MAFLMLLFAFGSQGQQRVFMNLCSRVLIIKGDLKLTTTTVASIETIAFEKQP